MLITNLLMMVEQVGGNLNTTLVNVNLQTSMGFIFLKYDLNTTLVNVNLSIAQKI